MSTFNRFIVTFGLSVVCARSLVAARGQDRADEPSRTDAQPPEQARVRRGKDTCC